MPDTTSSTSNTAAARKRKPRHVVLSGFLFGAFALAGVLIVLYAWSLPPFHSNIESTEDAMVRGELTTISPQVPGYIVEVRVQDFQMVHKGDLLMRIDERIYHQQLEQAQAQLASQQAALANYDQERRRAVANIGQNEATVGAAIAQARASEADLRRTEELATDGSLSERDRDAARADHAQNVAAIAQARAQLEIARQNLRAVTVNRAALEAAVENAQATVHLAQINLSYTRLVAPRDGQLGQIGVRLGAYVTAGTQVTALVPQTVWVVANFKETQMNRVRLGQTATFTVDALDHAALRGRVERISPAAGSEFAVIPPDNATGNFVKIAQRIPVRISIDPNQPLARRLRPGMSVVASIDTASGGGNERR